MGKGGGGREGRKRGKTGEVSSQAGQIWWKVLFMQTSGRLL